jgi:hypothetical protein
MIALWCCLAVSAGAVLRYGGRLIGQTAPLSWPTETPLNAHDNRAHDPHLARLTRQLRAGPTGEAHAEVRATVETLLHEPSTLRRTGDVATARARLGPDVAAFLDRPPATDPERYRRDLARALTRIETALVGP